MKRPAPLQPTSQRIEQIPLDKIKESIVTLRTYYDKEKIDELGDSIVDQGQLQTIVVQEDDEDPGYYQLIIGSRRVRSSQKKGRHFIAAYVIEKRDPADLLLIALAENLHRDDLNPFEEAQAFLRLTKEYDLEPSKIAVRINKPVAYITGRLQLLSMPDEIIRLISKKELPFHAIRSLARIPSGEDQIRLARMMITNKLSQAELGAQIQEELREPARSDHPPYVLTPVKLIAQIGTFTRFLGKAPRRMQVDSLNSTEKAKIGDAINKLRNLLDLVRRNLSIESSIMVARSLPVAANSGTELNKGEEWTLAEILKITASDRPTDPQLAKELGRTVSAIKSMRAKSLKA